MNKLALNSDKTHLMIICTEQKHRRHQDFGITLNTGAEIIEPVSCEKLLGGYVSNDFKWNQHLRDNGKSLFRILTSRINALSKMSKVSSFKTRKLLANGMVISILIYLIQVWGGCNNYLIKMLQVLQNRAARIVTKLSWFTPTKDLLNQCGWLSVKQLIEYHSLLLIYKIKKERKPVYLNEKLSQPFAYNFRQTQANEIPLRNYKFATTENSFIPRSSKSWNNMPPDLRLEPNVQTFKSKLKAWVKNNIALV